MALLKWVNMKVLDPKPLKWVQGKRRSDAVMTGDILGLTENLVLVEPHDPKTTGVGVVVLVRIGDNESPIFTDGLGYRRMSINVAGEEEGPELSLDLTRGDGMAIRRAIKGMLGK